MSDNIIELKGVNKWFGDFQVLKDVDLTVGLKQKIVVCGPSGSGKSPNHLFTFFNSIIFSDIIFSPY